MPEYPCPADNATAIFENAAMPLHQLPPDARPREKLLARGAAALSDSELLALLLRTGTQGRGVMHMAADVLAAFGGLSGLLGASADDLKRIKGLGGPAKRAELLAVLELARRAIAERLRERPALDTPDALTGYVQLHLAQRAQEVFAVLFLDSRQRLIALEELFQGTLTQTSVYPREVALRALRHQAAAVVLAHNHPSGQVTPSAADEVITRTLQAALGLIDVRVLDHLIVAPGAAYSMAGHGVL
jgi:DNA repair protein RadC